MVKFGIDWTKIALEVNDERKKAIVSGTKPADAFNAAYRSVTRQYPSITGEAWKEGRRIVGQIMAKWKREKDLAVVKAKRAKQAAPPTETTKKNSSRLRGTEVIHNGVKYKVFSQFAGAGEAVIVEIVPDTEILFMKVGKTIKHYPRRAKKVEKQLLALGIKIAKMRFAEKDKRQSELDL